MYRLVLHLVCQRLLCGFISWFPAFFSGAPEGKSQKNYGCRLVQNVDTCITVDGSDLVRTKAKNHRNAWGLWSCTVACAVVPHWWLKDVARWPSVNTSANLAWKSLLCFCCKFSSELYLLSPSLPLGCPDWGFIRICCFLFPVQKHLVEIGGAHLVNWWS